MKGFFGQIVFSLLISIIMLVGHESQQSAFGESGNLNVSTIEAGNIIHRIDTLEELKLLNGTPGRQAVYLVGRSKVGDGGGGNFRWLSGDQGANPLVIADILEGIFIKPASPGDGSRGVWVRQYSGSIDVKWFGATGNGKSDDRSAVQAAVDFSIASTGTLYIPSGKYRLTAPVIVDSIGIKIIGANRGRRESGASILYLDSTKPGDYAIHLYGRAYGSETMYISEISFWGTNNAVNQGGVLIDGRFASMTMERITFRDFTGYAIGKNPVDSYTQNNALRDISFYNVGGCYGLISEPLDGSAYLADTLLTIQNVHLDIGINQTAPKPYIWDFRGSREIIADTVLMEGAHATPTAALAFATNGGTILRNLHYEFGGTISDYFIAAYADPKNIFYSDNDSTIVIDTAVLPVFDRSIFYFGDGVETEIDASRINSYYLGSENQLVKFAGSGGKLTVSKLSVKRPFNISEKYIGRINLSQTSADETYLNSELLITNALLGKWTAGNGDLSNFKKAYFYITDSATTYSSKAIEADGNFLVQRYTGRNRATPKIKFIFDFPANFLGATVTLIVRYKLNRAGSDGRLFYSNDFKTRGNYRLNDDVEGQYATAKLVFKINTTTTTVFSRHFSTVPKGTSELRILSVHAYLGESGEMALDGDRP